MQVYDDENNVCGDCEWLWTIAWLVFKMVFWKCIIFQNCILLVVSFDHVTVLATKGSFCPFNLKQLFFSVASQSSWMCSLLKYILTSRSWLRLPWKQGGKCKGLLVSVWKRKTDHPFLHSFLEESYWKPNNLMWVMATIFFFTKWLLVLKFKIHNTSINYFYF